jgi:hypothetical protein
MCNLNEYSAIILASSISIALLGFSVCAIYIVCKEHQG